jgi:L-ascorbate metabolism protein UlaG (beta-lactamase superfamily)
LRRSRRWWIAGAGLTALGAAAGGLYSVSPRFRQFGRELGRPILPPSTVPDPKRWPDRGLHAAWLGHATVLVKLDGYTILTDPVLYSRIGLDFRVFTLGLKRMVAPALDLEDLPRIDLVLLSHAHMDHFDLPTLRALESRSIDVVTSWGTSDLLRPERWRSVRELRWGQTAQAGPVSIRAIEVRHWGARMRTDTWRGYTGYLLEAGGHRVLFGGDTAITDAFRRIRTARGIDLAIMPIGAYNPWIRVHCTPEQAWRMGNEAGAEFLIPVHHQTFRLSNEPVAEPLERLLTVASSHPDRVPVREIGAAFHL